MKRTSYITLIKMAASIQLGQPSVQTLLTRSMAIIWFTNCKTLCPKRAISERRAGRRWPRSVQATIWTVACGQHRNLTYENGNEYGLQMFNWTLSTRWGYQVEASTVVNPKSLFMAFLMWGRYFFRTICMVDVLLMISVYFQDSCSNLWKTRCYVSRFGLRRHIYLDWDKIMSK